MRRSRPPRAEIEIACVQNTHFYAVDPAGDAVMETAGDFATLNNRPLIEGSDTALLVEYVFGQEGVVVFQGNPELYLHL